MRETRSTQRYHGAAAFHAVLSGTLARSFIGEVCATYTRLFAYMGTPALLGILAIDG